jgi:hypothetical protein
MAKLKQPLFLLQIFVILVNNAALNAAGKPQNTQL